MPLLPELCRPRRPLRIIIMAYSALSALKSRRVASSCLGEGFSRRAGGCDCHAGGRATTRDLPSVAVDAMDRSGAMAGPAADARLVRGPGGLDDNNEMSGTLDKYN